MHYWICVDDTDMPGTKGTGWLLQKLCKSLEGRQMGVCSAISRHQLFVHEDVPYPSHNSSMCVEFKPARNTTMQKITDFMGQALEARSQKGSDPGLCVTGPISQKAGEQLTAFGKAAKQRICKKDEAYSLARDLGIHLSEHGGTGDGIIGALAGVGLRMSGNDGRYRGWYHLGNPGDILGVASLCDYPFIDGIVLASGAPLAPEEKVQVGSEKTKTVRLNARQVVVATSNETARETGIPYRIITKAEAKRY